jgi:hypothetical protein
MTNELSKKLDNQQLMAGGKVSAIIPQSMEDCYRLAKAVCMAGMAPRGMDTPEKAMIAIMRGMEVGLTPFQALDKIAVVNGRPTIWGDGAMALVRGSGLCESIRETIEGEGDAMTAICRAKRKGETDPIVGLFSVSDAKKAGLWGKQGPWQQFPKRMLQMRARAFSLRDGFADVLGGLYLREEFEETPRRQNGGSAQITLQPNDPPDTGFDFFTFERALRNARSQSERDAIFEAQVVELSSEMAADDLIECRRIMNIVSDEAALQAPTPPADAIDPQALADAIAEGEMAATLSDLAPLRAFRARIGKAMRQAIGDERFAGWKAQVERNALVAENEGATA